MKVAAHFFFVPHRLVWDEFEDFITGQATPTYPTISLNNTNWASSLNLWRYLGVGDPSTGEGLSSIPGSAYQLIWNEFFRDQEVNLPISNPAQATATCLRTNISKADYFGGIRDEIQQGTDRDWETY